MQAAQQHSLNDLTKEVTAFPTFAKFAEAMDAGYTPTLQQLPGRGKSAAERNAKIAELADRIESLGWKVWRGTNR
jgi:hypothetical protein